MLNIQHLTKTYGEKKAVDDLNLHIAPGEIYGFIGHNGAGKTTTLKSVAGILPFDEGEITIGGLSSIPGAMVAGLLVGVVESMSAYLLGATYQQLAYFVLFILVVLFKPQGILAKKGA